MIETFANVWDALEDDPLEAARMSVMSDLMLEMTRVVRENRWTCSEAAGHFRTSNQRVEDLLAGHIDAFQLDELVSMVAAFGRKVRIHIEAA